MHHALITAAILLAPVAASAQTAQSWMSTDVPAAWASGYTGAGKNIVIVDDFSSATRYTSNIGAGTLTQRHGEWVRDYADAIAFDARLSLHDFASRKTVALQANTLNILNLSYGMYARSGYSPTQIGWSAQERSIINYATAGSAVIAKAAGNDAGIIAAGNSKGTTDYLNSALVGKQGTLFVGALTRNGTPTAKASLASYSNRPGSNPTIQNQFLAVGVQTGLQGTSFAAPIVSGYAAIIGSKFTSATPKQVVNQLLSTARQDTILNYKPDLHGRGEASLARALAPVSIN